LVDFISKLQALEAIDEIGDWNKRIVTDNHTGQKFVAIYATNAWKMVDLRFKPATYNEKSLKVLIDKAGGKTNSVTLKFAADKAQVITYYNALITPRNDSDGNPLLPNKPRTTNRKAWLIPLALWGEENTQMATATIIMAVMIIRAVRSILTLKAQPLPPLPAATKLR
jgi:hypothetical protein